MALNVLRNICALFSLLATHRSVSADDIDFSQLKDRFYKYKYGRISF